MDVLSFSFFSLLLQKQKYHMNYRISFLFLFFCISNINGQVGKDGNFSTTSNTVINQYYSITNNANVGDNYVVVNPTPTLSPGDLVLVIQMQGASVNSYANPSNTVASLPNVNYGAITNYNNAGNYEFVQVNSVNGNTVYLDCPLQKNYTASGKVQLIKVPRYANLTVNNLHTIYGTAWNGNTGGVVAVEVSETLTINNGGKISADTIGFRGGKANLRNSSPAYGVGDFGHLDKNMGTYKGESIAGDTALYAALFSGRFCKGAVANGGGGGNAVNAGGGGGSNAGDTSMWNGNGNPDISNASWITAWNLESPGFASNVSSGGGRGGYTFSNSNRDPIVFGPNDYANWSGDGRSNNGGLGGRPLDYASGRIFLGGGGGAGDADNNYAGKGGSGGGIIIILNYGQIVANGTITANGRDGYSTSVPNPNINDLTGKDGGGGGGGGGAIVIKTPNPIVGTPVVTAKGGNGGNQQMKSGYIFGSPTDAYGPGGGGGGGYIGSNVTVPGANVNGGNNGIVQYISGSNNCLIDNNFPPNGATKGGIGIVTNTLSAPQVISVNPSTVTSCIGSAVTATAISNTTLNINWYSSYTGTTTVATGSTVSFTFTTPGTYTYYAGTCPGITRASVIITITPTPTITVNSATICNGNSATLTANGAATYTWNTGANTNSIVVNPSTNTYYTVTGSNGICSSTQTAQVIVNTNPTITVNSATICSGNSATLTANGSTTYTWNTGANTNSIVVNPSTNTNYTVTGESNNCSSTQTAIVYVYITPSLSITSNSYNICKNSCITVSYSPNTFTNVLFDYGDGSGLSNSSTYCYTITGSYSISASGTYTNGCISSSSTSLVNVSDGPVAVFNVPSVWYVNSPIQITNNSTGASLYNWTFNDGNTLITYSTNISYTYSNPGTYCIVLTAIDTANLCNDTTTKCILIEDNFEIKIPNIFTPNGDGVNDVFIVNARGIKDFYCEIYDRWGILMYAWDDVKSGWNGYTKNNTKVPTGTYYYLIRCTLTDETIKEFKGYLTLLE